MRQVVLVSLLATSVVGCSCDGTRITADAGPERDAAPTIDTPMLVLDTGADDDAHVVMADDAGSCCDRLGTTTEILWNTSVGVPPDLACPAWTLSDSAPLDAVLSEDVLRIETAARDQTLRSGGDGDDHGCGVVPAVELAA